MRSLHVLTLAVAVCLRALAVDPAVGAEPIDTPPPAAGRLAPQSELNAVNLTIIDEKVALSLAVETHIQIELGQFALSGIRDPQLRRLTEQKLRMYRDLLGTLDELTGGKATGILPRPSRQPELVSQAVDPSPTSASASRSPRKGGIGDIVQNATSQAILRVRLEIADQYSRMLRAELEAVSPSDYDARYLGIEAYNQMQVLAMFRVFERQVSPAFARVLHVATAAAESYVAEGRHVGEHLKSIPPLPPASPGQVVDSSETAGS